MTILKALFDLWTVFGFLAGVLFFDQFVRAVKLGKWYKKVLWVFCFGLLWWIIMPLLFFAAWVLA
jgi:hypothetical protein